MEPGDTITMPAMNRSAIAITGAVDNSHYSLVIAVAQAAGPCPAGEEAAGCTA